MNAWVAIILSALLLVPTYAWSQTETIVLLENFGSHQIGENLFVFGHVSSILPDKFLILQIVNPNGDLCQIQQLTPLSNGFFITQEVPLGGKLCGIDGQYTIKIYYGDNSNESFFEVLPKKQPAKTTQEYVDSAINLISDKIQSVKDTGSDGIILQEISSKLDSIISKEKSQATIESLRELFVDMENAFFEEADLYDIEPMSRQPINSILEYSSQLLYDNKITSNVEAQVKGEIYASMFYAKIGDSKNAIESMNEATILLANSDPIKPPTKRDLTFSELENLVLSLMTKNTSLMSRGMQEELSFIFARGTSPLHVNELETIVDILTKSRFLDGVLRNEDTLYQLVKAGWENLRSSLGNATTIDEFVAKKDKVDELYEAATLLRSLDKVDRFITDDAENNSKIANILQPRWKDLRSQLSLATSVDDIMQLSNEISNMQNVIEISSRISKIMELSQSSNFNTDMLGTWEELLTKVQNVESMDEILQIVTEFDKTILELQKNRNPLTTLEFEYKKLKSMAELQGDYKNLFDINTALRIISSAQNLEKENYTGPKFDRIEVLLAWASARAPEIRKELSSYSEEIYEIRASDVLQRAKAIENLVDTGVTNNRFLPGYSDFADSIKERINESRDLVIKKDLDGADRLVRQLFAEWQEVTKAYADNPLGSEVGYSADELRKIDFRDAINRIYNMASKFNNANFASHSKEFQELVDGAKKSVEYGNFVDAGTKISELKSFLENNLPLKNERIIFDISYDAENDIWTMQGAINNQQPVRENLHVTVYDAEGQQHSSLKFSDTRSGEFFTQWQSPTFPGMYVVILQYQNSQASQIVNLEEEYDTVKVPENPENVNIAREFEELENFINQFGGQNVPEYQIEIEPVLEKIKAALAKNDQLSVKNDLITLKKLIERYLPIKSRSAIIEADLDGDRLLVSGAVQKTLAFREELYLRVFDQQGNTVDDRIFYDDSSGHYNILLDRPNKLGLYVIQLEYHDVIVTDIIQIK